MKDSTEQTHEYRLGSQWFPCTGKEANTARLSGKEVRPLPYRELSKLEREINSILVDPKTIELKEGQTLHDWYAETIGELCRKKIELAFDAGYKRAWMEGLIEIPELEKVDDKVFPNKDQWIKDNL